jgi:hypothetical protein
VRKIATTKNPMTINASKRPGRTRTWDTLW